MYIGDAAYDSACAANSHVDFALATWSNGKKELVHPSDILNIVG
ncbi:MAG TPA: hypothetical protein PK026_00160 [Bacteroides graminisolvens]|nr:hypothetical protein [Bacteroides graminisolvens]